MAKDHLISKRQIVAVAFFCSVVFAVSSWANTTEVVTASTCGPVPYARLASGIRQSLHDELATKFAKNARNDIRRNLRQNFERAQASVGVGAKRTYGEIEGIAAQNLPSDPKTAQLVQRANALLQTEVVILDFAESTAKLAALGRLEKSGSELDPTLLIRAPRTPDLDVVRKMADQAGWGKLEIELEVEHPEYFRTRVLARGKLWFDEGGISLGHPGATHALQILMIQPHLEAEFGAGATRELLSYLSSREGFPLWNSIFDRGRGFTQDLRGPQAWGATNLLGSSSWLGIQ